jgi:hypothetical protein
MSDEVQRALRTLDQSFQTFHRLSDDRTTIIVRFGTSSFSLIVHCRDKVQTIKKHIKSSLRLRIFHKILLFDESNQHWLRSHITMDVLLPPTFCIVVLTPIFIRLNVHMEQFQTSKRRSLEVQYLEFLHHGCYSTEENFGIKNR